MEWSRRTKLTKIRRLYRSIRLGIFDDEALQDVGSELHARCVDIATVADAHRYGEVPCPKCSTKVKRQLDVMYGLEGHGRYSSWFNCPHCAKKLIWRDCREGLRQKPRCFSCYSPLQGGPLEKGVILKCKCGKEWDGQAYRRSVSTRLLLPCPHCDEVIRKPTSKKTDKDKGPDPEAEKHPSSHEVSCPKCPGTAIHAHGMIKCGQCGFQQKWKSYRRGLKKKDETLECPACDHTFGWQAWREKAGDLVTGNPQPARDFVDQWPKCRTPQERMMKIDFLLQTLHGQGALAPFFIEGTEESIRNVLDELATK